MPSPSMRKIMAGVDKKAKEMGLDKHKDYSDWRYSHLVREKIDGKMEDVLISHPDIESIKEDIRKTPLNPKEHPKGGHARNPLTREMTKATERNLRIRQLDAEYNALVGGKEGRKKSKALQEKVEGADRRRLEGK